MSRVTVAAHLLCYVNGTLMGEVTGMSWNPTSAHIARSGLDSIMAYELSPSGFRVQGSIQVLRLAGTGAFEGRGVMAPPPSIPLEKYFSLLILDRRTGKKVCQADYCKATGQGWNVQARGRLEGHLSFEGIEISNEAEY